MDATLNILFLKIKYEKCCSTLFRWNILLMRIFHKTVKWYKNTEDIFSLKVKP